MDYYLKDDCIGQSSKIEYGKHGDKVNILKKNFDMVLIENKGLKFWVKENNFTTKIIEQSEAHIEPTTEYKNNYKKLQPAKAANNQQLKLF